MRLRSKIIIICCISILFSLTTCGIIVCLLVQRLSVQTAEEHGLQTAMADFSSLDDRISQYAMGETSLSMDKTLTYLLKKQNNDLLICFSSENGGNPAIFNSTFLEPEDLEPLIWRSHSSTPIETAELKWEGMHFFVYRTTQYSPCTVYKLEDFSYVQKRIHMMGIGLIFLTIVIMLVVCGILTMMLNKILHPLKKLGDGAKQIAEGHYDERIAVERTDEIGELGSRFNQMAEAVQAKIRELQRAEEKRTLFMGNLTHELKTPMTAISGYARTLLTVKLPEEDREEALSYIYEESCRLERLSKKMMNLLLLEENDQIHLSHVPAGELFGNAKKACRDSLEKDGILLECHGDSEIFYVDADLFTEVLINLIDNARKASKRGDRIILTATEHTIEVRDFGKGIPKEEQEKILEPFYMIDKSRSRQNGGAGLGLAITSIILERLGCEMKIESSAGDGTRMILQFV